MNLSITVAMILLLLQLAAAARNVCQSIPGLPGRDGRDGKDGTPGVPGPAGPPGTTSEESCFQTFKTASSCKEIYDCNPDSPSGYYWISKDSSPPQPMYCGMNLTRCGNITGGWTRVAHFDMTNPEGTCLSSLETITSPRSCSRADSEGEGCSSVYYSTLGITFTQVCGQAIGYQHHTPGAFHTFTGGSIDTSYVDGLSITYDTPRHHLWTYAAGYFESVPPGRAKCPCAFDGGDQPPSFVQDHYYCESGSVTGGQDQWYPDDPLWDGEGCPAGNTCCDPPNLPWFNRILDTPSAADIELRLCQDQHAGDEDVAVELFELYVY